jgi:hypothetical protein
MGSKKLPAKTPAAARREEIVRRLKAFQDTMRKKYGVLSDSTPGICADRQARG